MRFTSTRGAGVDRERRRLLGSLAALPLLPGVSMLADTARAQSAGGACTGARSIVCLFLAGGADSFNLFVPGGRAYDEYRATRGELAVGESDLLGVDDVAQGGFGFNAALPTFARLYAEGRLSVVSNVGPLTRPTTRSDYLGAVALPQSLFAHNTQQKLWQTGAGIVSGSTAFGWGGAIAEHAAECNGASPIAPSYSIAGNADWLASARTNYISLNADVAVERMFGHDGRSEFIPGDRLAGVGASLELLIDLAAAERNPLMMRAIGAAVGRARTTTAALDDQLRANPLSGASFDRTNKLANQLHLVGRLIASREALGMSRQVFFVKMDGWDTHSDQLERLPAQLAQLEAATSMFQGIVDDLGVADSVTAFTASDFGRTLTSNGNGTDHGWGGHQFVFGGAVDGGRVVGETPSYAIRDNPDDAGEGDGGFAGRIIPRLSVVQYAATLSRWMGMDEGAIARSLPDLANFARTDLGLFRA